jgi:DMSO reductase anchor subunit
MSKRSIVGPLILVGLILFCAFQSSFLDGMKLLGEIVNIFGTVFVWLIKFVFSIPQVAEEIISKLYNSSKFVYSAEGQPSLLVDGGYLTELLKEYQNEK